MTNPPIDLEWVQKYVDELLEIAKKLEPGGLRDACLLRAEHTMDLVAAWLDQKRKQ